MMGWLIALGIIGFIYLAFPRRKVDVTLFDEDKIVTVDYTVLGYRFKQRILVGHLERFQFWKYDFKHAEWIDKRTGRTYAAYNSYLAKKIVRAISKRAATGVTQTNQRWAQQQYDKAIEKWIERTREGNI